MLRTLFILLCVVCPAITQAALHWTPFQAVPSSATSSFQLAVNKNSKALLAWHEPSDQTIKTSFYDFLEKDWTPPQVLAIQGSAISILAIHFTEAEIGALLWFDPQNNSLCLSKLEPGDGWTSPFILPLPFPVTDVHSLFDLQGNMSLVWSAWNGLQHIIQGVFFSETLQMWSTISDLSPIGFNCLSPRIAMNANGQGAVVWQAVISKGSDKPDQSFVQAVMFNRQQFQWSNPLYFGYDWIGTYLSNPDVAIDKANNIAILWENKRPENRETRIQYVRFLAKKSQWSYVNEMEAGTLNPQFGNNSQNIQVHWTACVGSNQGLNIAQFDIENNLWFSMHNLVKSEKGISNLKVKMDPLEKLNLMWLNHSSLQVVHYDKDWTPPIHLDKNMSCDAFDFANDAIGNVMLTILHDGHLLYCTGNYLLPPDYFEGRKIEVRYPSRKMIHGHLTWSHAESLNVMGYVLRRNSEILAILPVQIQHFTDYRCPNSEVEYELTIVNVDNIESLPVKRIL